MGQYPGFVYGSNESQSPWADCERTMNWYPEPIQSAASPYAAALYPCPGQEDYVTVSDINCRALFAMAGRCYAVMGAHVYKVLDTNSASIVTGGTVANDPELASIASNGAAGGQLLIASGGNGYLLDIATNTLSAVANLAGITTSVGMIDGYFLAFNAATSTYYISELNDGATWDLTQFAQRSIAPDPWVSMNVDSNRQIWLIGEQTGEVWYDAAIAGYARTVGITDAEAVTYSDQGHTFYCLTFPAANATWVYDLSTRLWHERGVWDTATGSYGFWGPRNHVYAFGKHLVGDRASGGLCEMSTAFTSECNGDLIRRLRIPPPLWVNPQSRRMFVSRFELLMEPGLGTASGQGVNPQVLLRTSVDLKNWSNSQSVSAGAMGAYSTDIYWTRLASSTKMWVPEIVVTDPIPWRIVGATVAGRNFQGQS